MSLPDEQIEGSQHRQNESAGDLLQPNEHSAGASLRHVVRGRARVRFSHVNSAHSAEASSFSFALEEGEVVTLADGALHISDDGSALVANELGLDLGDTTTRAGFTDDLLNGSVSDFSRVHDCNI